MVGRLFYIQVVDGKDLRELSQKYQIKSFTQKASRGNILSDNGTLMSGSIPHYTIIMDTYDTKIRNKDVFYGGVDSLAYCLSKLFKDKSAKAYSRELRKARRGKTVNGKWKPNRYYTIKRNVNYKQLKAIKNFPLFRLGKYKGGLIVKPNKSRIRPYDNLAYRTIGYQRDSLFVGLEGAFNEYLKGIDGSIVKQRIGHGDWKDIPEKGYEEVKQGADIYTTIDINVQDVAEEALYHALIREKAYEGCAVLMEVKTGYIKAIANLRWNEKKQDYYESYNMAIGKRVEPGSTFKLASMLVALEDEKISLEDRVNIGKGSKRYYTSVMRDAHFDGNSDISVRTAFEKSSNVGISDIIVEHYKDNPKSFVEGLKKVGLQSSLGVDIEGEPSPYIPDPDDKAHWYGTSLPWMSIGYGLSFTPLQILNFYNTIANDGRMMKPQFVSKVVSSGEVVQEFPPIVLNDQICSMRTIDSLKSLLEGVVDRGTGRRMASKFYDVAGKTGTAQIASNGKYNKTNYNASFVGYFPADNPRYTCIVLIESPMAGRYYGSVVAGPVFKGIADKVYATDIDFNENPPKMDEVTLPYKNGVNLKDVECIFEHAGVEIAQESSNSEYVYMKESKGQALLQTRRFMNDIMPNLKGMGVRDAVFLLQKAGLNVDISGKGDVIYQSIKAGTRVKKGQQVKLKLSMT